MIIAPVICLRGEFFRNSSEWKLKVKLLLLLLLLLPLGCTAAHWPELPTGKKALETWGKKRGVARRLGAAKRPLQSQCRRRAAAQSPPRSLLLPVLEKKLAKQGIG